MLLYKSSLSIDNIKERGLMFAEDKMKNYADNDYVKLQNMSYKENQILVSSTFESIDEEYELYNEIPDLYYNKVFTLCTVNLLFDYNYNCYYMTNSYLSRKINLHFMETHNKYSVSEDGEEKEIIYTYIDNTPYYDSLYLNDDFIYSFLLFTFIQQEKRKYYPKYDYKYITIDKYNNKNFMLSIIQIKDYLRDKLKEDFIINEIISYLI